MKVLGIIIVIFLLVGGVIAISGLIVSKKPNAAAIIDKLMPFQGLVGIALFILGWVYLIAMGPRRLGRLVKFDGFIGMINIALVVIPVLLGFYFSMLLIASQIPGKTLSDNRAVALADKLGFYSLLLGLVAIGTAVAYVLQVSGILGKVLTL